MEKGGRQFQRGSVSTLENIDVRVVSQIAPGPCYSDVLSKSNVDRGPIQGSTTPSWYTGLHFRLHYPQSHASPTHGHPTRPPWRRAAPTPPTLTMRVSMEARSADTADFDYSSPYARPPHTRPSYTPSTLHTATLHDARDSYDVGGSSTCDNIFTPRAARERP